jgi:hypothetical protein
MFVEDTVRQISIWADVALEVLGQLARRDLSQLSKFLCLVWPSLLGLGTYVGSKLLRNLSQQRYFVVDKLHQDELGQFSRIEHTLPK